MFSTSTAKRVAREAEKIVSLKEDMDAVSWTRVLEIGNQLQEGVEEAERIALARRHARLLSAREGRNIVRMRKHAMWYLAGLPGAAAARGRAGPARFSSLLREKMRFTGLGPGAIIGSNQTKDRRPSSW